MVGLVPMKTVKGGYKLFTVRLVGPIIIFFLILLFFFFFFVVVRGEVLLNFLVKLHNTVHKDHTRPLHLGVQDIPIIKTRQLSAQ